MDTLSSILNTFRLQVEIIHNVQYCGDWAVDTSGVRHASFHIITHGECFVSAESLEQPVLLKTGDFVLFPHDEKHVLKALLDSSATPNQQTPCDYSEGTIEKGTGLLCGYFQFDHPASNPLLEALPEVLIKHQAQLSSDCPIGDLLTLIQTESLHDQSGSRAAMNRLTESLFILIVREQLSSAQQSKGLAAALADGRIKNALDAIHSQPEKRWTLEQLATAASMSRSAFSSLFRSLLNESAMDYLQRWRMQNAWGWLEQGETVYSVAQRCGYESDAAFAKAFKKIMGMGPGAVRKRQKSRSQ